ncbi:MAG: hypothetical protein GY820_38565 [Gammaproteobacteria bacterium]|nr:hypothetical protein [Gammaproteobacteria bacterium]
MIKIYSSEWEAMLMTWEKKDLIAMLKDIMQHRDKLQDNLGGGEERKGWVMKYPEKSNIYSCQIRQDGKIEILDLYYDKENKQFYTTGAGKLINMTSYVVGWDKYQESK